MGKSVSFVGSWFMTLIRKQHHGDFLEMRKVRGKDEPVHQLGMCLHGRMSKSLRNNTERTHH